MSERTFSIFNKNYYAEDQVLYKASQLTLEANHIYCLVGCNGIGKSTILRQMVHDHPDALSKTAWDILKNYQFSWKGIFGDTPKQEDFNEFYFSANKKTRIGKDLDDLDMKQIFKGFRSTGENTSADFVEIFTALGDAIKQCKNKILYILLDDFDVGTSIDVLRDFVEVVKRVEKICKKYNVTYYIVITANAYEIAKNFQCIDCIEMKPIEFKNYEEYSDYVVSTRKYKDSRDNKRCSKSVKGTKPVRPELKFQRDKNSK